MAQKVTSTHNREGISLVEISRMFPDDAAAESWLINTRWPDGVRCPHCAATNVLAVETRKPQPYRCRACRRHFSVRTNTLMQNSKLSLQVWATAFYLLAIRTENTSDQDLYRSLGVTQKTAWHLAHRVRETWQNARLRFAGAVEADEAHIGGLEHRDVVHQKPHTSDIAAGNGGAVQGQIGASNGIATDLAEHLGGRKFGTVVADPPWRFTNRTGKAAPEHRRLSRYQTLSLEEICALPIANHMLDVAHCYLWVPNALLPWGLKVLDAWGFEYKTNIVWHKIRKDGGSDGRGVGFYFRNVTELVLFGIRGKGARTLAPGRRQVNLMASRKREHSRKPDEQYDLIEACSWGPYLELFGRGKRDGWTVWGNQAVDRYRPDWPTSAHNSAPAP
jgi:N6-adenosine-specific RNA methylase IME4/transposase-like protein